jgi:phage host-nuclease inhibitor protein Gam
LSDTPTAVEVPKNKKQAGDSVRRIEEIDRTKAAIDEVAARDKEALETERQQLLEGLSAYGEAQLPAESDGKKSINLRGGWRIYRQRSKAVTLTLPEREIVQELQKKRFWVKRFLSISISFKVKKRAVSQHPYITKKVAGLEIREMDSLYLGPSNPASDSILLKEHQLN